MIRWMRGAPALDNIKPQPSQYWGIIISIIYSIERSPKKARLPPTGLSSFKHYGYGYGYILGPSQTLLGPLCMLMVIAYIPYLATYGVAPAPCFARARPAVPR